MALTPDDINTIKGLLDELKQEIVSAIERRITTAETNLEREIGRDGYLEDNKTIVRLRREIQTSEDNIKKELQKEYERLINNLKP